MGGGPLRRAGRRRRKGRLSAADGGQRGAARPVPSRTSGRAGAPGAYESGGPTDNVLGIWKAAAPAIDILGPDDYQDNPAAYLKVLELYHRNDNPLYLPETGCPDCARFFFAGLGLQSIGFSAATDVTRPSLLGVQAGIGRTGGRSGRVGRLQAGR